MMSLKKFFYFVYFEGKRQIFILLTPDFGRKTLFFEREQSKNQSQNARTPDFLNNFFFYTIFIWKENARFLFCLRQILEGKRYFLKGNKAKIKVKTPERQIF